jgi:hypothetical protein
MHPVTRIVCFALLATLVVAGAPRAAAHKAGDCAVDTTADRCERWSRTYSDPDTRSPQRSDQFPSSIAASDTTVFATVLNTALDTSDPYNSSATWVVLAYDSISGELIWSDKRRVWKYDSPRAAVVSPDGRTLYVTGAVYDNFSVSATDSRIETVAYDAASGRELWNSSWEAARPGTDASKVIDITPDGRTLLVGGVTRAEGNALDYVTIAYDTKKGRERWARTYGSLPGRSDVLWDVAVNPDGRTVYVTGESAGERQYDLDFATIAYSVGKGRTEWVARHDGIGAGEPDRAFGIDVAPDGGFIYVTGDSWSGYSEGKTQFDYATVAYTPEGSVVWGQRYRGPTGGFNSPVGVVANEDTVIVSGQSRGNTSDDVRDYGTVAYDSATGTERWRRLYAPPRHDDVASDLVLSSDGSTVYVTGSSKPNIKYTSLDELATIAYDAAGGDVMWTSRLDVGVGNSLSARGLAATPDGGVAVIGQIVRSADPLEGPTSDVYDALIANY